MPQIFVEKENQNQHPIIEYRNPGWFRERLILTHGLQKITTTQTSSRENPGVTPLPVPYCPHFGSREPCHTCMEKLDGNSNFSQKPRRQQRHTITPATTTTRGQTDLKHISGLTEEDCHQPNRGPEGSSSSSSRTRSGKESSSTSTPGHPTGRV